MLTQIFKSILLMSAAGSVSALLWLCLKPVTRKLFSPKWQYYIWLTVLVVMILPIRLNLPKKTAVVPNIVTETAVNTEPQIQKNNPAAAEIPQRTQKIPVPQVSFSADIWEYLSAVWLFGTILVFAAKGTKYILFLRAMHKNSVRDTDIADIIKFPTNKYNAEHRKIITNTYEPKNAAETNRDNIYAPENIVNQFFASFGKSDFESMKKYCTQSCIETFFQKDGVYGMKKASLTDVYIDPLEFAKSSNGFNVFVTVDMVPNKMSVFDPRQTSTSFYVILKRQSDGRYLINEFATGL